MYNVCFFKYNCLIYKILIHIQCMLYLKDACFCITVVHGSLDIKVLAPGRKGTWLFCAMIYPRHLR